MNLLLFIFEKREGSWTPCSSFETIWKPGWFGVSKRRNKRKHGWTETTGNRDTQPSGWEDRHLICPSLWNTFSMKLHPWKLTFWTRSHEGLVQMIFLFKQVIFRFSPPLIFQGVTFREFTTLKIPMVGGPNDISFWDQKRPIFSGENVGCFTEDIFRHPFSLGSIAVRQSEFKTNPSIFLVGNRMVIQRWYINLIQ